MKYLPVIARVFLTFALLVLAVAPVRLPLYAHNAEIIVLDEGGFGMAKVDALEGKSTADFTLDLKAGDRVAVDLQGESDALVVVVSEETGIISVAYNGRIVRRLDIHQLQGLLLAFFQHRLGGWDWTKQVDQETTSEPAKG